MLIAGQERNLVCTAFLKAKEKTAINPSHSVCTAECSLTGFHSKMILEFKRTHRTKLGPSYLLLSFGMMGKSKQQSLRVYVLPRGCLSYSQCYVAELEDVDYTSSVTFPFPFSFSSTFYPTLWISKILHWAAGLHPVCGGLRGLAHHHHLAEGRTANPRQPWGDHWQHWLHQLPEDFQPVADAQRELHLHSSERSCRCGAPKPADCQRWAETKATWHPQSWFNCVQRWPGFYCRHK